MLVIDPSTRGTPHPLFLLFAPMGTVLLQFVNITIECVGVSVDSLSVSGNNYVKVWGNRPQCKRSKGCGVEPQSTAILTMFQK